LFEKFLPSLRGKVFHFTYSKSWLLIQKTKKVLSNKEGKFIYGSVHSHQSIGNYLGAVCLFDLRSVSEMILGKNSLFQDYFSRRITTDSPTYFLVLNEKAYSKILRLEDVENELKQKLMYMPEIESWYIDDLDLFNIEAVYEVSLISSE